MCITTRKKFNIYAWLYGGYRCCFRPVRKIAKSDCKLRHAVLSSARNNLAPIERICMKFSISGFFENLLKKFKFC